MQDTPSSSVSEAFTGKLIFFCPVLYQSLTSLEKLVLDASCPEIGLRGQSSFSEPSSKTDPLDLASCVPRHSS